MTCTKRLIPTVRRIDLFYFIPYYPMPTGMMPIKLIQKRKSDEELIEFCNHIISHSERYDPYRVFEAKSIIDNLSKQEQSDR